MGWKSTIDITRDQAIRAIIESIEKKTYDKKSKSNSYNLDELFDL